MIYIDATLLDFYYVGILVNAVGVADAGASFWDPAWTSNSIDFYTVDLLLISTSHCCQLFITTLRVWPNDPVIASGLSIFFHSMSASWLLRRLGLPLRGVWASTSSELPRAEPDGPGSTWCTTPSVTPHDRHQAACPARCTWQLDPTGTAGRKRAMQGLHCTVQSGTAGRGSSAVGATRQRMHILALSVARPPRDRWLQADWTSCLTRSYHTGVDMIQWLFVFNPYRRPLLMTRNWRFWTWTSFCSIQNSVVGCWIRSWSLWPRVLSRQRGNSSVH